jgi:hypothetical protein
MITDCGVGNDFLLTDIRPISIWYGRHYESGGLIVHLTAPSATCAAQRTRSIARLTPNEEFPHCIGIR